MVEKNRSPFFPGHPVPPDFFAGRKAEVERILRAIKEVEHGKQKMIFLSGEYGIGKSSFAGIAKLIAEKSHNLFGIHVLLSGAETIDDISERTLQTVIRSPSYQPKLSDKMRDMLAKYIGNQTVAGVTLNFANIKADAPSISQGYLPFLEQVLDKIKDSGIKGIFLILDDLNGITKNPQFAFFIKNLVDSNALNKNVPLLLMLCGTGERRMEMIRNYQPIDRIFEIVNLESMKDSDSYEFFKTSFESVNYPIDDEALKILCKFSAGFPKAMHIIGDRTYWIDKDGKIDIEDAKQGIIEATQEIGRQSVDEQVYKALRSEDYHNILSKLVKMDFDLTFKKSSVEKHLSETEKKKFHNFLTKMKSLNVLEQGDLKGEYIFTSRLVKLYIFMNSIKN